MNKDDAIINPAAGRNAPKLGPVSLMVASRSDLKILCDLFKINEEAYDNLYLSRLYIISFGDQNFSIVGPMLGAPYATIILETLIAWGANTILFFGWCGAVSGGVAIGDIVVPDGAIIDEGTSRHYGADEHLVVGNRWCGAAGFAEVDAAEFFILSTSFDDDAVSIGIDTVDNSVGTDGGTEIVAADSLLP